MQKSIEIANLSEFRLERKPFSIGGMSDKVYRAYRNGDTYFIKYGSISEVIAERVFNSLAAYCNLAENEVVIIWNDIRKKPIDSPFVVATKLVEGEEWLYDENSTLEISNQYAAFMAIKIFMIDDDPSEFILTKDNRLYSIDNSISGLSSMYLEILNGRDIVIKKFGKEEYDKRKKFAFEIACNEEILTSMPQLLFTGYKNRFKESELIKVLVDTLDKLSQITDETIERMTNGFRLIYSDDAVDCASQYLKTFRAIARTLVERERKGE